MSKSKLLVAITAGMFGVAASASAFAQAASTPSDTMSAPSNADSTQSKHKMQKHSSAKAGTKKTPAAETGNNAATTNGQSQ